MIDAAQTVDLLLESGVPPCRISDALQVVEAHLYENGSGTAWFTDQPGAPGALISSSGAYLTDPVEFVGGKLRSIRPDLFRTGDGVDHNVVEQPAPRNLTHQILEMKAAASPALPAHKPDDGSMAARLDALRNSPWRRR